MRPILDASLPLEEVKELVKKLNAAILKSDQEDGETRSQVYLALATISCAYPSINLDFNEDWLTDGLEIHESAKASLLTLLASWFSSGRSLPQHCHMNLLKMMKTELKHYNHQVKIGALKVLGAGTHILSAQDRHSGPKFQKKSSFLTYLISIFATFEA